tara:strand:+ start:114 stop:632 length:519 start_codon:yes stop_codon:yes gene_type:complete
MNEKVCFSFYRGEPPIPVTVFKETNWTFDGNLELRASIIGKSHRIICRIGNKSFTEFIAYPEEDGSFDPVDHFQVATEETHRKCYRDGDLIYQVCVETLHRLFENMADFMRSLEKRDWQTLDHGFGDTPGERRPFTGIAVDPEGSLFHTVHTYPEYGYSIVSRSEIHCPAER